MRVTRTNRRNRPAAVLLVVLLCLGMLTNPASANTTVTVSGEFRQGSEAQATLKLINDFRTGEDAWYWSKEGEKVVCSDLGKLTYDYALEEIAMQRAAEIAISFSHTRPDGSQWHTAAASNGLRPNAENIAIGYSSSEAAFVGFREDDKSYGGQGHRRAMLSSGYKSVGVAHFVYKGVHCYVQEFGTGNSSNTSGTVNSGNSRQVVINESKLTLHAKLEHYGVQLSFGMSDELPKVVDIGLSYPDGWASLPTDSSGASVSWESNDETIATTDGKTVWAHKPGKAILTARVSIGESSVSLQYTVDVTRVDLSDLEFSFGDQPYTGKPITLRFLITYAGQDLKEGTDFEVAYKNNINPGTAEYTLTGKGNFTGTRRGTFRIVGDGGVNPPQDTTETPTPTTEPTKPPTPTKAPTKAPTPTPTKAPVKTPTPTPAPEKTPTATPALTPTITPEPTPDPEVTLTPEITSEPDATLTPEPSPEPTATPVAAPEITPDGNEPTPAQPGDVTPEVTDGDVTPEVPAAEREDSDSQKEGKGASSEGNSGRAVWLFALVPVFLIATVVGVMVHALRKR